jgi:hypothetical protein
MRIFLSVLWLLALSLPAWAYVPPTDRVLEQWVAIYEKAPDVEIEGSMQIGAESYPFRVVASDQAFTYYQSGKQVTDSTSRFVFGVLTRPAQAFQTLRSRGLDTTKNGLARKEGRLAWTLGVSGERQTGSQLWLDRQTLAPLRLIYAPGGETEVQMDFRGYEQSPSKLFPTEIRVNFSGGTSRVYRIEKISQIEKSPGR